MNKNDLPSISSYGDYSSDNYGVNSLAIRLGTITLYYSYKTIVAYRDYQDGLIVHENDWRTTTGKHLNWLDGGDKKSRLNDTDFQIKLECALNRHVQWAYIT